MDHWTAFAIIVAAYLVGLVIYRLMRVRQDRWLARYWEEKKMALDWNKIGEVADEVGSDVLSVIKPFLPALKREGEDLFEGFVKHLLDKDFSKIDQLMYEKMTIPERRELEDDVYKDARAAAEARFRRKELTKQILMKALLRVALAFI